MWRKSYEGGEIWVDEGPDERRATRIGRRRLRERYRRSHPTPPRYCGRAVWETAVGCIRRPMDDDAEERIDDYLRWLASRAALEPGSVPPETPRELTRPYYCGLYRATREVVRERQGGRCAACGRRAAHMDIVDVAGCWHQLDPSNHVMLCAGCYDDWCDARCPGRRRDSQRTLDSFRKPLPKPLFPGFF